MKSIRTFMENGNVVYGKVGELRKVTKSEEFKDVKLVSYPSDPEAYYFLRIAGKMFHWQRVYSSYLSQKNVYDFENLRAATFVASRAKIYYIEKSPGAILLLGHENILTLVRREIPSLILEEYMADYPYVDQHGDIVIYISHESKIVLQPWKTYSMEEFGRALRYIKAAGKRFSAICRKYRNMGVKPLEIKEVVI